MVFKMLQIYQGYKFIKKYPEFLFPLNIVRTVQTHMLDNFVTEKFSKY